MLLDLIIPLFSFRWPWLLMSSNSSWSASLFLFAVVALFRPESPAFAVVIRVRRSSNLYQYKSNRSASFKPQPPFIYIYKCVCVCMCECWFDVFLCFLSLIELVMCYLHNHPHTLTPLYLSIPTAAFAISHGRATPQFGRPQLPSLSSSSSPSSLKSLQWFFCIHFCVSRAFRYWFVSSSCPADL